jgi:hypothetical protein
MPRYKLAISLWKFTKREEYFGHALSAKVAVLEAEK